MTKAAEIVSAHSAIDLSNYCLWQEPDRGVRIYLRRSLVSRLHSEVLRGSDNSTSVYAEVGGILLGSRTSDGKGEATLVEDFVPVPCDYELGPFYCLSRADTANFESVLETCRSKADPASSVVGYYRSHNRDDLYLTSDDLKLIHKCFSEADKVFLLIKTLPGKPCTAGFFFWENGYIQSEFAYLEIPFSPQAAADFVQARTEIEIARPPVSQVKNEQPKSEQPQSQQRQTEQPQSQQPQSSPEFPAAKLALFRRFNQKVWLAAGVGLALAMIVILVGLKYGEARPSQIPGIFPASNLALHVQRNAGSLALTWNTNSPDVVKAQNAILDIHDGDKQTTLQLAQAQLRSGKLPYTPLSEDIQFDLQIYRNGKISSVDSLHLVMANPTAAAAMPAAAENVFTPTSQELGRKNSSVAQPIAAAKTEPLRTAAKAEENREPQTNHFVPPNDFLKSSTSVSNAANAREKEAGLDPPPSLAVETQPQTLLVSSTFQSVAPPPEPPKPKIEQKTPDPVPVRPAPPVTTQYTAFIGPHLIRQVSPRIPADLRPLLTADFQVDVEVSIDDRGKVSNARVTSSSGIGAVLVTKEVLEAARLSVFQPARKNNTNVPSSMVLSFHFKRTN